MSRSSQNVSIPWSALFFALLGLAWCGYVAFPTGIEAPCETSGCGVIRDAKIAGISLWWVGGGYFFILAIMCLRGARFLAWRISRLALFADSLLLLAMFFTGPCADCLTVAVFFALTTFTLRPPAGGWFQEVPASPLLLPIWLGLFLGNMVIAADEAMPRAVMGNAANTEVRLYFSPSCPACREALLALDKNAALYPIKERDGDTEAILRLAAFLDQGLPMSVALTRCLDDTEPVPPMSMGQRLTFTVQLLRNKASVLKQGFHNMPLIMINGMPGSALKAQGSATQNRSGALPEASGNDATGLGGDAVTAPMSPRGGQSGTDGTPDFLQDLDNLGRCAQGSAEPCE